MARISPLSAAGDQLMPKTRSKRLVIRVRQSARNSLVSREYQSNRCYAGRIAARCSPSIRGIKWIARIETARIDVGDLPGTVRLHFLADVRHWRIHFPAQPIVQRDIRTDLPAVLGKQVHGRAAHQFRLGRALAVAVRQSQKEIRVAVSGVIRSAWTKVDRAVHVVIQRLVEHLVADVAAKLDAVRADDLAEVIRKLIGIPRLRQLPFKVVSQRNAPAHGDKGQTFFRSAKIRENSVSLAGRQGIAVAVQQRLIGRPGEAIGRNRTAGTLHRSR